MTQKHYWMFLLLLLSPLVGFAQQAPVWHTADNTFASGSGNTISISRPANLQTGDLVLVSISQLNSYAVTPPAGFVSIQSVPTNQLSINTYYKIATASEPATYGFALSGNVSWRVSAGRVSGAHWQNPVNTASISTFDSNNADNATLNAVTTNSNQNLLVAAFAFAATTSGHTPAAGMANAWVSPAAPGTWGTYQAIASAGSTGNKSFGWNGRTRVRAVMFSIQPATPDPSVSAISAQDEVLTANGSASTPITVQIKYTNGDNHPLGGDNVSLSTTAGSLSTVTDNGDGTYTAILTASTNVETATVSGSLNGQPIGDTATVQFVAGEPNRLIFFQQPTTTTAGSNINPAVVVHILDANNNLVTTATNSIALAFENNAGGGTLGGTATVSASGGVATFSNLLINTAANGYTLRAEDSFLTPAVSNAFNIAPGNASQLTILQQPTNTMPGQVISPPVSVRIEDALGNLVESATLNVQVALQNDPSGAATLGGTLTRAASAGIATFNNLTIDEQGSGYTLQFTATGLNPATSQPFEVMAGVPAQLSFVEHPTNTTAGESISPPVTVIILDGDGNMVNTADQEITISIGNNPGGGNLGGQITVQASGGAATFSDLFIEKTATGYTLTAAATGLAPATSNAFNITPAPAHRLSFQVHPSSVVAGELIQPQMEVRILDQFGNLATGSSLQVTLAIGINPGGGTLMGTATRAASQGVALFNDIAINKSGTGYTFLATASGLVADESNAFQVVPAAPSGLETTISANPSIINADGSATSNITVQAKDAYGNPITTGGANVLLQTSAGSLSSIIDQGNGVYRSTLTASSTPETANITGSINGEVIAHAASVVFRDVAGIQEVVFNENGSFVVPEGVTSITVKAWGGGGGGATEQGGGGGGGAFAMRTISTLTTGQTFTVNVGAGGTTGNAGGNSWFDNTSVVLAPGGSTGTQWGGGGGAGGTGGVGETTFNGGSGAAGLTSGPQESRRGGGGGGSATETSPGQDGFNATGGAGQGQGGDAGFDTAPGENGNPPGGGGGGGGTGAPAGQGAPGRVVVEYIIPQADPAQSTLAADDQSLPAGGTSQTTIRLQLVYANGDLVTTGGDLVTMHTTAGTLSGVTDHGNGSYTTLLTASTQVETAQISANINGEAVTQQATVEFTPLPTATLTLSIAGDGAVKVDGVLYTGAVTVNQGTSLQLEAIPGLAQGFSGWSGHLTSGNLTEPILMDADKNITATFVFEPAQGIHLSLEYNNGEPETSTQSLRPEIMVYNVGTTDVALTDVTVRYWFTSEPPGSDVFIMDSATLGKENTTGSFGATGGQRYLELGFTESATIPSWWSGNGTPNLLASGVNTGEMQWRIHDSGWGVYDQSNDYSWDPSLTDFTVSDRITIYHQGRLVWGTPPPGGGEPEQMTITQQPVDAVAGVTMTPSPSILVEDALGNPVAGVNISISVNQHGFSGGSTTVVATNTNGLAVFDNLRLSTAAQNYTITFEASGAPLVDPANSSAFNVVAATATNLLVQTQPPAQIQAGDAISPAPAARVTDEFGNPKAGVSVQITLNTGSFASGTTTATTDATGVATFTALEITQAGSYHMVFESTASGLGPINSQTFQVIAAAPHLMTIITQPGESTSGGVVSGPPSVRIADLYNNPVSGVSITVYETGGYPLDAGTLTLNSGSTGMVVFSNLEIQAIGTGYQLGFNANATGVDDVISVAFDVLASAASMAVETQPLQTTAGEILSPAPSVIITDTSDNPLEGVNITVSLNQNSFASGTLTRATNASGQAVFNDLIIEAAGTGYQITFDADWPGAANVFSGAFDVVSAQPAALAFTSQPGQSVAGSSIAGNPAVTAYDAFGNPVAGAGVSVSLNQNSFASGTTNLTTNSQGVATFTNLVINTAASGYSLTAQSTGTTPATSNAFQVIADTAASLTMDTQPQESTAGISLAPAPSVFVSDAHGNPVAGVNVTASINKNAFDGGSNLIVTSNASGLAVFSNLVLSATDTGYILQFTATGLTAVSSQAFDVVQPDPPFGSIVVEYQNMSTTPSAQSILPYMKVSNQSGFDLTLSELKVRYWFTSEPAGNDEYRLDWTELDESHIIHSFDEEKGAYYFELGFAPTAVIPTAQGGDGTPNKMSSGTNTGEMRHAIHDSAWGWYDQSDDYSWDPSITVYAPHDRITAYYKGELVWGIPPAAVEGPVALSFEQQPQDVLAGVVIQPAVEVAVVDRDGAPVALDNETMVTLAIGNDPTGNATLGGQTTATVSGGVAVFNSLTIDNVGTGFTLVATAADFPQAISEPFNVLGPPTQIALTGPAQITAGNIESGFTIQVLDAMGQPTSLPQQTTFVLTSTAPGSATYTPGTTITIPAGQSQAIFSYANTLVGEQTIAATWQSGFTQLEGASDTHSFTVIAAAPQAIFFTVAPAQVDVFSPASFQLQLRDAYGNPSGNHPGFTNVVSVSGGAGSLSPSSIDILAGQSETSFVWQHGTSGTYTLTAGAPGIDADTHNIQVLSNIDPLAFAHFKQYETNHELVAGTAPLVDFPVLFSYTHPDFRHTSHGGLFQNIDGYDAVFTAGDKTTVLDHNLEYYNPELGTIIAWVRFPSLSATQNTAFHIHYGNNQVGGDLSTPSTWDANYQLVMHMHDTLPGDASTVGQSLTNTGTSLTANGQIDGARNFSTGQFIQAENHPSLDIAGDITISMWVNPSNIASEPDLVTKGDWTDAYSTSIKSTGEAAFSLDGNNFSTETTLTNGSWYHLAFTKSASGRAIYINGQRSASDAYNAPINTNTDPLFLSSTPYNFEGSMDEVRISNVARSAEWIATKYNNQQTPGVFLIRLTKDPDPAHTTITAMPTAINANGSEISTITVQAKDEDGTNIDRGGATVVLQTTAGSLSAVTDNLNGTYTAPLTAAASPSQAIISGSINGATIADQATVDFLPGPATQLVFSVQPSNSALGSPINPPVQVEVRDAGGHLMTQDNVTQVNISLASDPTGQATLSGQITVTVANGVATFNDLNIDKLGEGFTLEASATGLASGLSAAFNMVAAPHEILLTGPTEVVAEQTSDLFTLTVVDVFGNPTGVTEATTFALTSSAQATASFHPAATLTLNEGESSTSFAYSNTQDGNHLITATWTSGDLWLDGAFDTHSIWVLPIPAPPVLSNMEATPLSYTVGSGPQPITHNLSVDNAGDKNLSGATVQITGNYQSGLDVLAFPGFESISGNWNATTGTLSLSGAAPPIDYQNALRQVTYEHTGTTAGIHPRTISFSAFDGDGTSNALSREVNVVGEGALPGLLLWLKGEEGTFQDVGGNTQTTAQGEPVRHWKDQSGNERIFSTGGTPPTLDTSVPELNGQSAIRFAGTGDELSDDGGGDYINGLSEFTFFVVIKSDLRDTDRGFWNTKDPDTQDNIFTVRYDAAGLYATPPPVNNIKLGILSNAPENQIESYSDVQVTHGQIVMVQWKSGDTYDLFVDGIINNPALLYNPPTGYILDATKALIGKSSKDGATSSWDGLIAEVMLYNRKLDNPERLEIEDYLSDKYGISIRTLTPARGGEAIPADDVGGSYTTLTGPIIKEGFRGMLTAGETLVFEAPEGFEWDTGGANPTASVSPVYGGITDLAISFTSRTSSRITFTVNQSSNASQTSRIGQVDFAGLRVRPTSGQLPNQGSIRNVGTTGFAGTTNYGDLTMVAGSPASIAFTRQPSNTTLNEVISPGVRVQVYDVGGNLLTTSGIPITLSLSQGSGSLSGTLTQNTNTSGFASFADLSINETGVKKLEATSPGLTGVQSNEFTILLDGVFTTFRIRQLPALGNITAKTAGQQFQIRIEAVDGAGNVDTEFNGQAVLSSSGTMGVGEGTTPAFVDGVLASHTVSIQSSGTVYLTATRSGGSESGNSNNFAVSPGSPSAAESTISAAPSVILNNGSSTSQITVQLKDAYGNNVTTGGATVSLATNAGSLSGVTDQGNGTYTAILTSSINVTTATVTGNLNGQPMTKSVQVSFAEFDFVWQGTLGDAPTADQWEYGPNWNTGTVPGAANAVLIPSNPSVGNKFPVVSITGTTVGKVVVETGASLTISGGVNMVIEDYLSGNGAVLNGSNQDTLTIGGELDITSISLGTVVFAGNQQQSITNPHVYTNLSIDNPTMVAANSDLFVNGELSLEQGILRIPDNRVLIANNKSIGLGQLQFVRTLSGPKGWRMLGSPVASTYGDLLDGTLTQGYTGSTLGTTHGGQPQQPNVFWYDETFPGTDNQRWRAPAAASNNLTPGRGLYVYVFGDVPEDARYNDPLPHTLEVTGLEHEGDGVRFHFDITYTLEADTGWNFVSNPFGASINWDSPGWTKTNMDNTIYVWNPSANGGNGEFVTWNGQSGTHGSGIIRPFQGFWVKANEPGAQLSIAKSAKTTGGIFRQKDSEENTLPAKPTIVLKATSNGLEARKTISFRSDGQRGKDPMDGYRLLPITDTFLALYSTLADGSELVVNNLPTEFDQRIMMPVHLDGYRNGQKNTQPFTISWPGFRAIPSHWVVRLIDHETGEQVDLKQADSYTFNPVSLRSSGIYYANQPGPNYQLRQKSTNASARFTLMISTEDIEAQSPADLMLVQNFPNPFRESTTIEYGISEAAEIDVEVFNLMGQRVAILAKGRHEAGYYQVEWQSHGQSPGVYICVLRSGNQVKTLKMSLVP